MTPRDPDAAQDTPIAGTDTPPLPPGAPIDFRERLALHLKTCTPDVLAAAERDFKGTWSSADEYVHDQVSDLLPPHALWLLACCDADKLRLGYEAGRRCVWTIRLEDDRVLVFDSLREPGRRVARA